MRRGTWIPVGPILRYLSVRGWTVADAFPHLPLLPEDREAGAPSDPMDPQCDLAYKRWLRLLIRAEKRGDIDLFMADEFCCDVLGVHPSAVYGTDWFDFGAAELAKTA